MSNSIDLRVHAKLLEQLSESTSNERIAATLINARNVMLSAAEELDDVSSVPTWVIPLQDSLYMLAVAIIQAGWITRTMVIPSSGTYNVHKYAVESYEKLFELLRSDAHVTTRSSMRFPHTTRRKTVRDRLRKAGEKYNVNKGK